MNQSATHTWILTLGLSLLLVGSGLVMLATPLLSSTKLPSAGQRVAVPDSQFEEEPELPDPIIPIPNNPEPEKPQDPEPSVPEPSVPEPSVPEPSVPEPSVPEPSVPEPENPEPGAEGRYLRTLLELAPQLHNNRLLQIGPAGTPAMI